MDVVRNNKDKLPLRIKAVSELFVLTFFEELAWKQTLFALMSVLTQSLFTFVG